MEIPQALKNYLCNLDEVDAEQIWDYLDSDLQAASEMINIIADTHKELHDRLCGDDSVEAKELIAGNKEGVDNEQVTGRLENWGVLYGQVWGKIYGDSKHRFQDGTEIHTSNVLSPSLDIVKEGDVVITKNSRYLLGKRGS